MDRLCQMANQIAGYFRAYPAPEAQEGIVKHIDDFWTPKMRSALHEHIKSDNPNLDPLVKSALAGSITEANG